MRLAGWLLVTCACAVLGCALGVGNPCTADAPCPSGLVCQFPPVSGGGTATSGVCDYPLRAEGEPCTVVAQCDSSLTCSNHFSSNERYGTCVAKRPDGEACFMDRDCRSGNCAGESGTALDGVCAPRP